MRKSIRRDQLRLGMFIHRFEGSWFKHPFWRARFLLEDDEDLATVLDSEIERLIIDTDKGVDVEEPQSAPPLRPAAAPAPARPAKTPQCHRSCNSPQKWALKIP